MVAHGDESAAEVERLQGCRHGAFEGFKLVVHFDAQRLEGALGGVAAGALRGDGHSLLNNAYELTGGFQGRVGAGGADGAGDTRCELLFAPVADNAAQLVFAVFVDNNTGGELIFGVHAHVQGRVVGVGEAAGAFVQLHGGDAQVHQDAVDALHAGGFHGAVNFIVDGVDGHETLTEACQTLTGDGVRLQVAVNTDQNKVFEAFEQRLGVATHAEGAINNVGGAAFLNGALNTGRQQVNAAVQHDGHVAFAGFTLGEVLNGCAGGLGGSTGVGRTGFGGVFYAHGCSCESLSCGKAYGRVVRVLEMPER